jgi:hypothetical protein
LIPFKTNVFGVEVKAGEINLYKLSGALAAAIMCHEFNCVEKTVVALFKEEDKEHKRSESPAEIEETSRRRQLKLATSDDPLHEFVATVASEIILKEPN